MKKLLVLVTIFASISSFAETVEYSYTQKCMIHDSPLTAISLQASSTIEDYLKAASKCADVIVEATVSKLRRSLYNEFTVKIEAINCPTLRDIEIKNIDCRVSFKPDIYNTDVGNRDIDLKLTYKNSYNRSLYEMPVLKANTILKY